MLPADGFFFIIGHVLEAFSVSFESPQSGWMSLRLRAGKRQFLAVASHRPYDSLRDLLEALAALVQGRGGRVKWNAEPEEFDFEFDAEGNAAVLRVVRHAGHGRESHGEVVFTARAPLREICLRFCDEILTLRDRGETDEFESNWRRPFPEDELGRLCAAVEHRWPRGGGGRGQTAARRQTDPST